MQPYPDDLVKALTTDWSLLSSSVHPAWLRTLAALRWVGSISIAKSAVFCDGTDIGAILLLPSFCFKVKINQYYLRGLQV